MAGTATAPGTCALDHRLETRRIAGFDRATHGRFGNTFAVAQNPILDLQR